MDSKNLSFTGDVFGVEDFCMLLWWDLHWRYLSKRVATAFITSPLQSFCRDVRQRNRLLLSIFSSLTTLNFAKQHTHTYTYTTHIEDISGSQFSLWHTKEREKRRKENRTFLCQKKKKKERRSATEAYVRLFYENVGSDVSKTFVLKKHSGGLEFILLCATLGATNAFKHMTIPPTRSCCWTAS